MSIGIAPISPRIKRILRNPKKRTEYIRELLKKARERENESPIFFSNKSVIKKKGYTFEIKTT